MTTRNTIDFGAETGEDAQTSMAAIAYQLDVIENKIATWDQNYETESQNLIDLNKRAAWLLLNLKQTDKAWLRARPLFDIYIETQNWPLAIEICEILFQCAQTNSLPALGQGVWLAVTFPVDPKITVNMLQYVIDETADDSDGAAVAAATAVYVYNLREHLTDNKDLYVDAMQMLSSVGRRHSDTHAQSDFDNWIAKLELMDPEKFLPRLRNVIDVLVQDEWWFDRDGLQATLPKN